MSIELQPTGVACSRRCSYCLDPDTPVLLSDGSWRRIDDVEFGSRVIAFDEVPTDGPFRKLRETTVTDRIEKVAPMVEIRTDRGAVRCTLDHEWLVGRYGHHHKMQASSIRPGDALYWISAPVMEDITESRDYRLGWLSGVSLGDGSWGRYEKIWTFKVYSKDAAILDRVETWGRELFGADLRRVNHVRKDTGDELSYSHVTCAPNGKHAESIDALSELACLDPRDQNDDFARGWLAGFFDAEGTRTQLGVCQKDREPIEAALATWLRFGFDAIMKQERDGSWWTSTRGGNAERMRFWSEFRPVLSRKLTPDGLDTRRTTTAVEVQEVVPLDGEHRVVDLVTEAITFVAGGFLTWDCYQEPMRAATNNKLPPKPADGWARMKAKAEEMCSTQNRPTFFGGEAMLLPDEDLEALFAWAFERFGGSGVQSEGSLVRPHHFEWFEKYSVQIGFSIDGPGELNRARVAGTVENTDRATERSIWSLEEALRRGHRTSLHVVLHRISALPGQTLDRLIAWLHDLDDKGLRWLTIHPMERDGPAAEVLALSEDQLVSVFERLDAEPWTNLRIGLLADMRELLLNPLGASVPCVWNACDPLTTPAVQGIGPDGEMHNCGRVNKLGADAPKADGAVSHERYLMLHRTPQDEGGCQGCRFFAACKGFCPGTAVDGDWRMKTEHCGALMRTFERLEIELTEAGKTPYTASNGHVIEIEQHLIRQWSGSGSSCGTGHGDAPHGDSPHGDSHVDSDAPDRVLLRDVLPVIREVQSCP